MLQISTGKFYPSMEPEDLAVTVHRGVLYTNYQIFRTTITTGIGTLSPLTASGDDRAMMCEVTERLPVSRKPYAGMMVSTGPDAFINDFSAIASFRLNVVCTPDIGLAARLLRAERPALGADALPKTYIPRFFDSDVASVESDERDLADFASDLVGLSRRHYVAAMRAIRRYVMAMHRIGDEIDLAYALLVASIESLVQEFDGFAPVWDDYAQDKRKVIDRALVGAPDDVAGNVRKAILSKEHVALARRFREYTREHLKPSFFREEARLDHRPAGHTAIMRGLRNAYDLRSAYVHKLAPLPRMLKFGHGYADVAAIEDEPFLTLHGLARIARHVILGFVAESEKKVTEKHDFAADYPNVITLPLAGMYWLPVPSAFKPERIHKFLSGFLQEIGHVHSSGGTHHAPDMRAVIEEASSLFTSVDKTRRRRILALQILFSVFLPDEEKNEWQERLNPHLSMLDNPSIESLVVHFIAVPGATPWPIGTSDRLLHEYHAQRFRKNGIDAGATVGCAMVLWLAEQHRVAGNEDRARALVKLAIEEYPAMKRLLDVEARGAGAQMHEIDPWKTVGPPDSPLAGA